MRFFVSIWVLIVLCWIFTAAPALATSGEEIFFEADAENAERIDEIKEMRTENSKTYLLSDGSYQYVGYADAIHYSETEGRLEEIDNQIMDCSFLEVESKLMYGKKIKKRR